MNHILRDHIAGHSCVVYCDDILIFINTDDPAEQLLKLTAVLETLRNHELLIKGSKTELFRSEVEFLGFQLSQGGWAPTESKVAAIVECPAPETVKHLRSFLGMANFFRSFIPVYSEMAAPLTELLKKHKKGKSELEVVCLLSNSFYESEGGPHISSKYCATSILLYARLYTSTVARMQ